MFRILQETKRAAFARFYFLSNDELLEILSETKDPTKVQPHLKKCFEAIKKVKFEEDLTITAMISGEGEQVKLDTVVDPNGANVEAWMTGLENEMRVSVRARMWDAIKAYREQKRTDWCVGVSLGTSLRCSLREMPRTQSLCGVAEIP